MIYKLAISYIPNCSDECGLGSISYDIIPESVS